MPKTSFVLTAIILYWLYLWRTHRKGGPALVEGVSTPATGGTPGTGTYAGGGTPPVLPSVFSSGLPFGTPGINGGYQR